MSVPCSLEREVLVVSILSRRTAGLFVALAMVGAVTFALTEPARGAVIEHTCATAGDLQAIIDAASPGDIIEVAAGVCTGKAFPAEDFSISKDIVLRGAGAGLTVLQGSGAPNSRVVGVHEGAVVTLEGLTITGGTIADIVTQCFGVWIIVPEVPFTQVCSHIIRVGDFQYPRNGRQVLVRISPLINRSPVKSMPERGLRCLDGTPGWHAVGAR